MKKLYSPDAKSGRLPAKRRSWAFVAICRDCGEQYKIDDSIVDAQVDTMPNRIRLFMLHLPNECPACHSLHVVGP
jgi:hypothetical protein